MNNEEQYYEVITPLIEEGLVREVFSSENVSVLNIADAWYMVNLRNKVAEKTKCIAGFLTNQNALAIICEDEKNYNIVVEELGDEIKRVVIDKKFVKTVRDAKKITMESGPTNFINYELEEELAKKNGSKRGR